MAGESALYKKFRAEQDAADAAYKSWEKDQWNKNSAEWTKQGYTRTDAPNNAWGSTWSPKLEIEVKEDPTKAWYDHMKTLGYKEEALDDGTKRFTHNNNLYYSNGRAKVDGKMIDYDYKTLAKAETPKLNPKSFDLETFRKNEGITSSNYITHAGNQYLRYDPDGIGDFYVGTDGSIYQANWFGGGLGNKLDHTTVNRDLRGTYLSNYNNLYNLISNFNVPTNKQGGTMNKVKYFAQGGAPTLEQVDPEMQAKADDLVLKAMQGDTKSQNSVKAIIDAAKKQDAKALQLLPYIQRAMEKVQSQAASAKWGSKLQYIRSLKFAKGGKSCPVCDQQKVEMKKCGGKKAKKHQEGGEFYFNETNPMRMSNGRNVVGIVNRETFKNPTNIGISQTVYNQSGRPVVQKDKTSNGGEREIYYNVPKSIKRKGFIGSRYEMGNDTVYVSGTPEMFLNSPNMSTSAKMNQANRFAYGM